MKALDTNVVVRFLVCDDAAMTSRSRNALQQAKDAAETLLIPDLVLLETLWVLRSPYKFARGAVIEAVERLLALPPVRFESHDLIHEFIRLGRISTLDLPDILIGLRARQLGCEITLTFDKKAAQSELFEEVA
jgi:predicted nucleic-acid-binding protein